MNDDTKRETVTTASANGRFAMVLTLIASIIVLLVVMVGALSETSSAKIDALSEKLDREMADRKEAVALLDRTLQNELAKTYLSVEKEIGRLDHISDDRHNAQQAELIYRYETLSQRIIRLEREE